MSSGKKSDFTVQKLQGKEIYSNTETLRKDILNQFSDKFADGEIELGYIAPGHGLKGKQKWICSDDCLTEMYQEHKGKKEVMLWCVSKDTKAASRKRSSNSSPSKAVKVSKGYSLHQEKMMKTQATLDELRKKHEGKYSEEKLHTWANLIEMKKHSSLDEPPDLPFFRGYKKTEANPKHSNPIAIEVSPVKRLTVRTTLLEQLEKCVGILEKGGLTQAEYNELQQSILKDIRDTK